MGKEMTKMKNAEPLVDYKLLCQFQRRLDKQPLRIRLSLKSMAKCCRKMIPASNGIVAIVGTRVGYNESNRKHVFDRTGFHGTCKCHNLWACPVCSAAALTKKAKELTDFLASNNYAAFMITFTIPHTERQPADCVIKKFKLVRRQGLHGAAETYQRTVLQTIGSVTTNEVTRTAFGWHYHQHVLYIVRKENWQYVEEFCRRVEAGWNDALKKNFPGFEVGKYKSGRAVMVSRNCKGEVLQVADARYLFGYGVELTKSTRKRKCKGISMKAGSRNLFDLITGTDEDFDLLCEWLLASRKLHRITYSRGLKKLMDKPLEKKIISPAADIETVVVASFTKSGWHNLTEAEIVTGLPLRYGVLRAALDGYNSVAKFCRAHNLELPFPPDDTVYFTNHGTSTEIDVPPFDNSVRKADIIQWAQRKDASVHEGILTLTAQRAKNLKAVEEYRRWAAATYRNSASLDDESGAADIG